jgi:heme exporter protein C
MRTLAAVLAIFGYCDVPIVYMSTRWWRTQHPAPVFFGGPGSGVAPDLLPPCSGTSSLGSHGEFWS